MEYPINKITVDMASLGYDIKLLFSVTIMKKMKDKFGHDIISGPRKDVLYVNEKYETKVRNISIGFDYSLILRFFSSTYGKYDLAITIGDYYWFRNMLRKAFNEIYSNYDKIYQLNSGGDLIGINKDKIPIETAKLRFCSIKINPSINRTDNGFSDSINITALVDGKAYVGHMWADSLAALTYLIDRLDMFGYAYSIASPYINNYYNTYDMETKEYFDNDNNKIEQRNGFSNMTKPAISSINYFKKERNNF